MCLWCLQLRYWFLFVELFISCIPVSWNWCGSLCSCHRHACTSRHCNLPETYLTMRRFVLFKSTAANIHITPLWMSSLVYEQVTCNKCVTIIYFCDCEFDAVFFIRCACMWTFSVNVISVNSDDDGNDVDLSKEYFFFQVLWTSVAIQWNVIQLF